MPRMTRSLTALVLALSLLTLVSCASTGSESRPVSRGPECDRLDAFAELAVSGS